MIAKLNALNLYHNKVKKLRYILSSKQILYSFIFIVYIVWKQKQQNIIMTFMTILFICLSSLSHKEFFSSFFYVIYHIVTLLAAKSRKHGMDCIRVLNKFSYYTKSIDPQNIKYQDKFCFHFCSCFFFFLQRCHI